MQLCHLPSVATTTPPGSPGERKASCRMHNRFWHSSEAYIAEKWRPTNPGCAKLNVDGMFVDENGIADVGMLLRDPTKAIIFTAIRVLYNCGYMLEAELAVLREGTSTGPKMDINESSNGV